MTLGWYTVRIQDSRPLYLYCSVLIIGGPETEDHFF